MEITTRDLQEFFDLKEKIAALDEEISARKTLKDSLVLQFKDLQVEFLEKIDKGAVVNSKKFIVAVKDHFVQAYINWQKEYKANHPKEYVALKEERGKTSYKELQVARREVV